MAKALKTAALVVGAVALVATGVGAVAAAGSAIALAAGTVATVANVTAGALALATTLTAKKPSAQATGRQEQFAADPDAGIPWIIGRTGTGGNIVYRRGFDTKDSGDNDRQSFVAVLSLGPVAAVESFTVDRASVTFNGSGQAVGAYSGFMWQTTQLGALSGPALGFGTGAGTPPGWSASHRLSGKAAATWTLRFDTKAKLFQNGVPAPMWVVRGAFCYDPRKDSTYPGGSGSHRMADPADTAAYDAAVATWEWTENPYLLGLRFVHGIWQRDVANSASKWQRVMGMGAPQSGIDLGAFVEGANVAQANGWAAGGVIFSGDDKWQSLKKILQAGMGEPLALGAKIGCLVNAPKVSLATIGIDDVVGDASVGATQPRRSRVNTITPRYRLEANNWQLLPGSPITVADYVTIDRGRRSRVQDYPFIQNNSQVGTAVRYDIENAREFGPIVLPLKLFWMGYKPGDCVTATLPELGLNAQPILLLNRSLDPSAGVVTMTARSETPGKHPFALGQTATPPPTPGVTGAPIVPTPGETAWAITGNEVRTGDKGVPALIVTGSVDVGSADAVVFEYRPFVSGQSADAGWIAAGIETPTTTRKEIVSVAGEASYEVAVSYRARGIQGGRRILGPITTAPITGLKGDKGDKGDDGSSAYALIQTNENHIVPANADGTVISYNGATTTIQVIYNGQDVSSSFALSLTAGGNPQALATTISGRTVSVTGGLDANEPNALLGLTLTGSGSFAGTVLDTSFSLTKSRAGADGTSPPLISIAASSQVIRYDKNDQIISGSITLTATRQRIDTAPFFRLVGLNGNQYGGGDKTASQLATDYPGIFSSTGPDSLTITQEWLAAVVADGGGGLRVTVFPAGGAIADVVTLVKVKDGTDGLPGADAYQLTVAVPQLLVKTDANNVTKPEQFPRTIKATVKKGTADVTSATTLSVTPSNGSIAASIAADGNVTITAANAEGSIIVNGTYQGIVLTPARIEITRQRDTLPPGTATQLAQSFDRYITSTSYIADTYSPVVTVNTATGQLRGRASAEYATDVPNQNAGANFNAAARLYYRVAGSGTAWSDMGTEQTGTPSTYRPNEGLEYGSVGVDRTISVAAGNYEIMAAFRKVVGTAPGAITRGGAIIGGQ